MANFKILSIIFLSTAAFAAEIAEEENVLVLTKDNFDDALKQHTDILVEFYAPWCGHCKALAPEYAKAAKQLADEGSHIKLAKVDATIENELAQKYGIRGYPTLKFFKDAQESEYGGPREAAGIVAWLKKKTGFPAAKLADVDAAKSFINDREVAVIGFFESEDSAEAKAFVDAVRAFDDVEFGFVTEKSVAAEHKVQGNKIVLFKKFDEGRVDLSEDVTKDNIINFIKENSLPLFIEFNQNSAQRIFSGDVKNHLLVFMSKESENFQRINDSVRELAKGYKNKLLFVFVDTDNEENGRIIEFFGLTKEDLPAVRLISLTDQLVKYKPDDAELNPEKLKVFIDNFLAGKLKPHLNTQDVPKDWDAQPVKVLVGKNFDEVAFDKSKDVLVEFYAPWCGHCKKLAPIYDELGEAVKDRSDIVIAKMDATVNELEHTKIESFPTIKLYRKDDNEVVEYNGARTLEAMKKFVESSGKEGNVAADEPEEEEEEEGEAEEEDVKKTGQKDEL